MMQSAATTSQRSTYDAAHQPLILLALLSVALEAPLSGRRHAPPASARGLGPGGLVAYHATCMEEVATRAAVWVLALSFAWAAAAKLIAIGRWRDALSGYHFGPRVRALLVPAVPVVEACIAAALVASRDVGAALALGALAAFSLVVLVARRERGDRLPCGCFGGDRERDYRTILIRNAGLAVLAALVLVLPAGEDVEIASPGRQDLVPVVAIVAGAALIVWTIWTAFTAMRRYRA